MLVMFYFVGSICLYVLVGVLWVQRYIIFFEWQKVHAINGIRFFLMLGKLKMNMVVLLYSIRNRLSLYRQIYQGH